ncbi:MAG TPA: N-acetyltransferase [Labilithrix sp.]|nr:N-acetyltransferase [Labilithrix sp.]
MTIETRDATPTDEPFLWHMLVFAASMDGSERDIAAAKTDPTLCGYVDGFGRPGDLGIIAIRGNAPQGAVWSRLLAGEPHPSKVWTHDVPELAIATLPSARGQNVGTVLLRAFLEVASTRFDAVMLSVRVENPAVRLYERHGFVTERRVVNRVGGISLVMRRDLR